MSTPQSVDIRTVGHEHFHHRDAISIERGSHQRSVASLVHIRPVLEHPPRHGQSRRTRWFPWDAAFRYPRERSIFAVTKWRPVQRWVARHHGLGAINVVVGDRVLELTDLL